MSSLVQVNTYTHSVTYVTDQMLRSLRLVIVLIGLDQSKFLNSWESNERAIKAWLQSGHLKTVILEIIHPTNGALVTRCDFQINYGYGGGDGTMWVDTEAIRFAIRKLGVIPSTCSYKLTLMASPGHPPVEGWGDGALLSTVGFTKQGIGTTIGTHAIGAGTEYWRRS